VPALGGPGTALDCFVVDWCVDLRFFLQVDYRVVGNRLALLLVDFAVQLAFVGEGFANVDLPERGGFVSHFIAPWWLVELQVVVDFLHF
jgi:hypothetical protein